MTLEGQVLSTVTTIRFDKDKKPFVHISLAFLVHSNLEHGFISGDGILWMAKILHTFNLNNLEEIIGSDILISQDSKDTPMDVRSKETGLSLGLIDPLSLDKRDALNSEYDVYKMKESK